MKVGLVSLGCPKNLVDSEVMLGLAREAGHELTQDASQAEVLVVNTCAFIDAAKRESINTILEMARYKHDGECRRLIVTGCLAERYRDELKAEMPEIDAVLGTGEVPQIVDAIGEGRLPRRRGAVTSSTISPLTFYSGAALQHPARTPSDPRTAAPGGRWASTRPRTLPTYIYDADTPRLLATAKHYAYVKIAEGCDYKCAFCIIPTLRGAYRSRPSDSILNEARTLVARGVRELILISQDTTFYGIDRRERGALARLLRQLNAIDGLEWIRLLYLYPTTIDDDMLGAMADCDRVCKYIDLPLQHASDPVLRRMKRPGSRHQYDRLLANIRRRVPAVALRTTFIVGFPGETDADVDALCAFAAEHGFDHLGVFTYSHEEGTSAHAMPDDVPARVKRARRDKLMSLQRRLVRKRNRGRVGERVRVVVDGAAPESALVLKGRLPTQAPEVDGTVYLTDVDPTRYEPGDFVEVQIVASSSYDLIARPLDGVVTPRPVL